MFLRQIVMVGSALALCCEIFGMPSAASAGQGADDVAATAGVKLTLDKANALMLRSGSVKALMEALYEDDLVITGEGQTVTYQSLAAAAKPLADYMDLQAHCKMTVIEPVRSSGNLAAAFIQEHCDPAKKGEKPDDWRILGVFRNGAKGWRMTMETFSGGVF
jgi:hypothetical protein